MKRLTAGLLLALVMGLLISCQHSTQTSTSKDKVVIAYVTSWSEVMPDPSLVTHINYAFGHVTDSFNGVRINNEERLRQIVALKEQAPQLKEIGRAHV